MFNVYEYVNNLVVSADDETVKAVKDIINMHEILYDDGYLARAQHWGSATSMENQLSYLGGRLLPSMESKLNNLKNPRGILAEDDLRVSFTANESQPHINEDVLVEDQIAELEARIDQVHEKMRVAGIAFALYVKAHDEQSALLNLLSYSGIKAQAAAKRERRSA